jgi:hypothetical protein
MPLFRLRITNAEQGYTANRPAVEMYAGDVDSADGAPRRLNRVMDRRSDRYVEQVTDLGTGQVVRFIDEPLTAHRDRGSAKPELRQRYRRRGARRS